MAASLPQGDPWPDDNRLKVEVRNDSTFHAYLHVPFCVVRCGYCDFNTYTANEIGDISQSTFHESLIREIEFADSVLSGSGIPKRKLETVFIGGGTPSLFSPSQIGALLTRLEEAFGFGEDVEITMEANPEGLTKERLAGFYESGINRFSIGVQSFDEQVLKTLDRVHTAEKVRSAARDIRELGARLSLDLIYGAPGESLDSWSKTLDLALELKPEHVSAYALIVEEGTALARRISRGEMPDIDEDLNADKYLLAEQKLTEAGLENYEVSNWGEPCRHNQAYWRSMDWWGFGPGAHSHISGTRFWNHKHPASYSKLLLQGSPIHSMESLDARTRSEERLLLELRTSDGVDRKLLRDLGVSPQLVSDRIASGQLRLGPGGQIVPTLEGRLLVDGIVLDFLTN